MDKLPLNIKVKCIGALLIKWTRFFLKKEFKKLSNFYFSNETEFSI